MSENDKQDDETQPVRPEGAADLPSAPGTAESPTTDGFPAASAAAAPAPAAATGRRGFRERFRAARQSDGNRAYSLGALIASALAGVIVGGVGVATFQAVTDDRHDGPGWIEQRGPMGRDFGDRNDRRGPMFGGPGGIPGQVQPTTPPEDDESGSSS